MKDALQQFQTLKAKLSAERERLQTRLAEINAVLNNEEVSTQPAIIEQASNVSSYEPRKGTLPAKILKVLRSGTVMQVKDVATALKRNRLLVNQACLMLLNKGCLKRAGRGQYSLV